MLPCCSSVDSFPKAAARAGCRALSPKRIVKLSPVFKLLQSLCCADQLQLHYFSWLLSGPSIELRISGTVGARLGAHFAFGVHLGYGDALAYFSHTRPTRGI